MGDIAFNLLIFFVILARAQDDSHLQWQPANAAELQAGRQSQVSVVIDKESRLYLNGGEIGLAGLEGAVSGLLGDAPKGERNVVLKIHKDALGQRWGPVLEAVGAAGGEAFLVLEEQKTSEE